MDKQSVRSCMDSQFQGEMAVGWGWEWGQGQAKPYRRSRTDMGRVCLGSVPKCPILHPLGSSHGSVISMTKKYDHIINNYFLKQLLVFQNHVLFFQNEIYFSCEKAKLTVTHPNKNQSLGIADFVFPLSDLNDGKLNRTRTTPSQPFYL